MLSSDQLEKAYESGVLDKEHHQRLIENADKLCAVAGIPARALLRPMSDYCTAPEIDVFKRLKFLMSDGVAGVCYTGKFMHQLEDKFISITAACIRNYIDARLMTVHQIKTYLDKREMPEPTVLVIPNFFMRKGQGAELAPWEIGALQGLLLRRFSLGKFTFLYSQSMQSLRAEAGESLANHIETQYITYEE